ncbi:hypothetical protein DFH08DRAFT_165238 [Mycena albidolilacea]|uniref:F-box domain-containing protein n=1 Tax=Mycena albidolilacea TaxID=1033008 RepID=A0AAD7AQQ6_9AGAR|nr:hypothetical protein DFH08DRAFT_165238 [Mycena albidolilacea]
MDSTDSTLALGQMSPTSPNFESIARILIAASEANIARIESQMKDLERLRDRERGIIARLRIAIAPVHKLPAELLAEIFLLALDSDFTLVRKEHIQKVQALSHVCAYWRCVAHTTPRLWTNVLLTKLDEIPKGDHMVCLKGWLERSAPMPIPVSLEISGKAADAGRDVIDIIAASAHRWTTVHLNLPSLSVLSRIPTTSLKLLERVVLASTDAMHHAETRAFLMAERLRRVHLITLRTGQLLMPWSQLTEVVVKDPSPQDCLDTVIQCTSIVSARFETRAWPDVPDLSQRQIAALGRLEDLSVSFRGPSGGCVTPFFVRLALPALKKLCLDLDLDHTWSSAEFTQFQLRSSNIQRLEINNSYMSSDDLLAILQHAPFMVQLHMECCPICFDDSIVGLLQYSATQALPLAPKLEVIHLDIAGTNFEEDALDVMIQSRWWTDEQLLAFPFLPRVARWAWIEIHCGGEGDNTSPQFEVKLEEYRSQGLDVSVR